MICVACRRFFVPPPLPDGRRGDRRTCSPGCGETLRRRAAARCRAEPLPTPAEIAERCAEVRAGWSDEERLARLAVKPPPWMVPVVRLCDLAR